MSVNRGKQFEARFKEDFKATFPEGLIVRIYDVVSGNKAVSNLCDFFGYVYPNLFLLECKSHDGNTFPFTALSQYDKLVTKVGIHGVRVGVVLWMKSHDTVVYIPIASIRRMKENGCKSFNIKMLKDNKYKIIEIPSIKKRVFMESDYRVLTTLDDGD